MLPRKDAIEGALEGLLWAASRICSRRPTHFTATTTVQSTLAGVPKTTVSRLAATVAGFLVWCAGLANYSNTLAHPTTYEDTPRTGVQVTPDYHRPEKEFSCWQWP